MWLWFVVSKQIIKQNWNFSIFMIIWLFLCFYSCVLNKNELKISRNKKHKYSNEEKLALVENENTSALINIAQEDDSNIFELLQNLGINNLESIILKMLVF